MATEFRLDFQNSNLNRNLGLLPQRTMATLQMYATTRAPQIRAKMQTNRPWTDRTGMAKARLDASVSTPNNHTVRITLSHGVEYGIWLELANEKNYAIIMPTINQEGPHIVSDLQGLFNRLRV